MTDFRALCAELVELSAPTDSIPQLVERLQNLAELANRARAALAQPEPQGPTGDDMNDLADDLLGIVLPEGSGARLITRALELWGRPAIEPVPVSERLPGPEDCDAEGKCWWFDRECDTWSFNEGRLEEETHWAPHWALPVPGVEGADA
jgi:hypothetical protein